MKNLYIKLSILLLAQLCGTAVSAQIEKGSWMATGKSTMYVDPLRFSIQGDIGYMLSNRLMVIPSLKNSYVNFSKLALNDFNFGLEARYYYLKPGKKLAPFVGLRGDLNADHSTFYNQNSTRLLANTGVDFMITPNLAFETQVYYDMKSDEVYRYFARLWGLDFSLRTFLAKNKKTSKKAKKEVLVYQVEKGDWVLNGNANYVRTAVESPWFEPTFDLILTPKVGLALSKHWIVGLSAYTRLTSRDYSYFGEKEEFIIDKSYASQNGIGVFGRYLHQFSDSKWACFAEAGYTAAFSISANKTRTWFSNSDSDRIFYGQVGVNYFLSPKIALEASFIHTEDSVFPRAGNHLEFGLQAYLPKQSKQTKP
ncbi:outer membrane beta-barrel protein [Haliscomenobacter hydrossis]|uniref:Uncharacterized protein n=1 Tax=Haliscomenobacter hydrossis (strain ATCC 27775 / DSM 1100 / LMG 10767 / O) TaxID=760192 RepID=F4L2D2_HALH1|nr:outer membrane beta-barrel protein [Haliscomenobacter hydrossis]AEE52885.1 hypothetical protein Halhy_5059 [Haliscomenobacter hydrossis DSM 1100]